jgi:hypothetical protein
MIILIFLIYAALIVFGAINNIWWMVAVFAVVFLLTALGLCCFWSKLQTGILLLEVAATFLTQKPTAFLASLYPLFFGLLFLAYWIIAIICELYYFDTLLH